MPTYEVEINGEQYEVEAPDEKALSIAVTQIQGQGAGTENVADASGGGFDGALRSVARGALGIGSYLDEMDAATNATLAPIIDPLLPDSFEKLPGENWQDRYDQALGIQRRKDRDYDEANPVASTALKMAGGIGSGGALLKAAPIAGNYILGNTGAGLGARLASATAAGGGAGFIQGFGAGEGDAENRSKQGLYETVLGMGTGAAMVPVSAGISAGVKKVTQALLGQSDDALSTMGREGRRYVTQELADPNKVALQQQALKELGPDAMLADVSPDWLGVARGAATRPGTRGAIIDPLQARHQAATSRLRTDMETSLGPRVIPSQIEQGIDANQALVREMYGPLFRNSRAVDTRPIAEELEAQAVGLRGGAQRAVQNVRQMLNATGTNELDPDPATLLQTRHAIDGLLNTEADENTIRALTFARRGVDDALAASVPGIKDVDAQFSELARQRTALGQGRRVLNNEATAIRPEELQDILAEGALPQGTQVGASAVPTRIKQSARGEIDRAVGTNANDTTALRKIVRGEGDWNRDKLAMLFGQDNADAALKAIDRERTFEITGNKVMHGSDTAMANRFGAFLDDISRSQEIPMDTTLLGAGLRGARSVARSVMNGNAATNANQVADDIGRISVARGPERDALVEAIMKRGQENVVDQQRQKVIDALIQSMGRSGYQSLPGVRN